MERGRLEKALLADFGEAKEIKRTLTAHGTRAGTPLYMAPEMKQEEDAKGPKADVFSAGVVSTPALSSTRHRRVRRCWARGKPAAACSHTGCTSPGR